MDKKHFITRSKLTIIFICLIILLDQIIKAIAISITNEGTVEAIKGVLNFTYIKNTGGAFGIASETSTFLLINIIVIFLLIRFLVVNREKVENEIIKPKDDKIMELYQENLKLHNELSKQVNLVNMAEKYQKERNSILADNKEDADLLFHNALAKNFCDAAMNRI